MPKVEMTDRWLKYKRVDERTDFFDDRLRTFGVRVAPSGTKSWFVLYTPRGQRRKRRLVLGRYPEMGLSEARMRAGNAIDVVRHGGDPKVATGSDGELTFADLAREYMLRHSAPKKRSTDYDREVLERDLLPAWGPLPAASIKKRDAIRLLDAIADRGAPILANRTRQIISSIYRFGVKRDLVEHNPITGTDAPATENRKSRYLSDAEIADLWTATSIGLHPSIRDALRMILLTGQRPGEVAGMVRSEVDGDTWVIPAARHKGGRDHAVPLVGMAAEIVSRRSGSVLFPTDDHRRRGAPVMRASLSAALRRMFSGKEPMLTWAEPATPHDLRRTAATHLGRLGSTRFVIQRVLGHSDAGVGGIYDRWSYMPEKRAALEIWDAHVSSVLRTSGPAALPDESTA